MEAGIKVEPSGSTELGVCDCCGRSSRSVWGFVYAEGHSLAAYFVHWTVGHVPDQGASIDLILGEWGEGATEDKRFAVALAYRLMDSGPSMMVIDAEARLASSNPLVGRALSRGEVIGTHFAEDAFAIADAVLAQDDRVAELLGGWKI